MKKLFVTLMIILSSTTMASCYDAYYAGISNMNKATKVFAAAIAAGTIGSGIILTGSFSNNDKLITAGAGITIGSGIIGMAAGAVAYAVQESKEEELLILSIADLAGADSDMGGDLRTLSHLNSLVKRAQKQNSTLEMNDVLEQIKIGFDSEDFCQNNRLHSWNDIQTYVINKLK